MVFVTAHRAGCAVNINNKKKSHTYICCGTNNGYHESREYVYISGGDSTTASSRELGIPGTLHGSHNNNTSEQIMYHLTKSRKKKKNNERKKTKIKKKTVQTLPEKYKKRRNHISWK